VLALGACEGPPHLRDVEGTPTVELQSPQPCIAPFAFSSKSDRILLSNEDELIAFDIATGRARARLSGHRARVAWGAFSEDGQRIVTASEDGAVRLFRATDGKELFELRGHAGALNRTDFSRDGTRLVTGGADGTVRIWDVRPREPHLVLDWRGAFATLPGERIVVLPPGSSAPQLWDARGKRPLRTFAPLTGTPRLMRGSPDGSALLVATDGAIHFYDVATGSLRRSMSVSGGGIWDMAFSPAADRLALSTADAAVRVIDEPSGRVLRALADLPHRDLSLSIDGRALVLPGCPPLLAEVDSGDPASPLEGAAECGSAQLSQGPRGPARIYGCDRTMHVWDGEGRHLYDAPLPLEPMANCDAPLGGVPLGLFDLRDGRALIRPLDLDTNVALGCRTLRQAAMSADARAACEGR
jgi:WD40 repeat protein